MTVKFEIYEGPLDPEEEAWANAWLDYLEAISRKADEYWCFVSPAPKDTP